MKRGDIVTISLPGEYGKPRPGLIFQSDLFILTNSVTVLPLTSHLIDAPLFRVLVEPNEDNGLKLPSHIMVDKLYTTARDRVGDVIGHLETKHLLSIERAVLVFLGMA